MFRVRFVLLATVLVLGTLMSACGGEPPEKEMQQAQGAIDAARAAGAPEYAKDEFDAAVKALDRANQAAADRDYRQALNDALDARTRAQTATKDTADRKARLKVDIDKALTVAERGRPSSIDNSPIIELAPTMESVRSVPFLEMTLTFNEPFSTR